MTLLIHFVIFFLNIKFPEEVEGYDCVYVDDDRSSATSRSTLIVCRYVLRIARSSSASWNQPRRPANVQRKRSCCNFRESRMWSTINCIKMPAGNQQMLWRSVMISYNFGSFTILALLTLSVIVTPAFQTWYLQSIFTMLKEIPNFITKRSNISDFIVQSHLQMYQAGTLVFLLAKRSLLHSKQIADVIEIVGLAILLSNLLFYELVPIVHWERFRWYDHLVPVRFDIVFFWRLSDV